MSHPPVNPTRSDDKLGLAVAASAFLQWGLLPIYWKLVADVPPAQVLAHRIVWTAGLTAGLATVLRLWKPIGQALGARPGWIRSIASALLIGVNWYAFLWAVDHNRLLEASLGYYINPLVNVMLGRLLLGEHLRRWQAVAVGLALAGVAVMIADFGPVPWIALVLAGSFSLYGLLRKTSPLDSLGGLTVEMLVLAIPAGVFLAIEHAGGRGHYGQDTQNTLVLSGAGIATAMPLLCFAWGARRVRLASVGVLQYIGPSLMFALGVLWYEEPFTPTHVVTFGLIWSAVALYCTDALRAGRKR